MKMFCITLESTPERTESAKQQFGEFHMDVEFVSGINGKEMGLIGSDVNKELNAGQIGCYLTHFFLWKKLLNFQN
jgi:glycosyl transferase family 25